MSESEILGRYRRLPYKRRVDKVSDEREGTYYVCTYPDLPGLTADGETRAEAVKNAEEAFDDYILGRLHFGDAIPEPEGAQRVGRAIASADNAPRTAIELEIVFEEPKISVERRLVKRAVASMKEAFKEHRSATTRTDAELRIRQESVVAV